MESERSIFEVWPALRPKLPLVELGRFPTPVQELDRVDLDLHGSSQYWVKRDDLSSDLYGGNKVRTLELLFGEALAEDARIVYSTGAYGSNHALAAILHAPSAGLEGGAVLFPQPRSAGAVENLQATLAHAEHLHFIRHWSTLPLGIWTARRYAKRLGKRSYIMVPGGATPLGAIAYVSAALELAFQVARGELPRPKTLVLGVGSTCTSAGLLLGLRLAAERGIGFVDAEGKPDPPRLLAVRVTPWPVTSPIRIVRLAVEASELLASMLGDDSVRKTYRELRSNLEVTGTYLGRGYGYATTSGREAIEAFAKAGGPALDTTYSGKAAAAFLRGGARDGAPLVFWSTKSTAPLPTIVADEMKETPRRLKNWIG